MTAGPTVPQRSPRSGAIEAARLTGQRVIFGALDRAAPALGAQLALRAWCRLPGNAGRRKDFRPGTGAVATLPVPRGGTVVAESWGRAGADVVYLVHGWGGWRGQLGAFVAPLVDAGFRVVAFDAPSHGESTPGVMGKGRGTVMESFEAFEAVAKEFGDAAGVVAHSMGCTTAAFVLRAGLGAERLVLIAPNHDFVDITRDFAQVLGFGERTRSRLQDAMEDFCERPIADFDLIPLGSDGALPPTLVVHDRQDKETPFVVGQGVAAAWPRAELLATQGLGHQRILADPAVVAAATAHLSHR